MLAAKKLLSAFILREFDVRFCVWHPDDESVDRATKGCSVTLGGLWAYDAEGQRPTFGNPVTTWNVIVSTPR